MAKNKTPHFDPQWAKAKNVCRLNMEDIRMAKALGMSPKALLKNNPSPAQRWKAPVKHWIRERYEKRFGRPSKTSHEPTHPYPSQEGTCEEVCPSTHPSAEGCRGGLMGREQVRKEHGAFHEAQSQSSRGATTEAVSQPDDPF